LRSHFYVTPDAGHLPRPEFDALMASAEELARVIGGLRAAVARNRP